MRIPKRTSSAERAKGPIVLLVEDVMDVRVILAEILVREGFGVVEASNGHEAIVKAHALKPDVIVMDLWLPQLDGVQAVRILRSDARTRHIPVIALTGQAVDPAVRKEFEHVLLKPCMPDMLVLRVRSVVRHVGGRSRQS